MLLQSFYRGLLLGRLSPSLGLALMRQAELRVSQPQAASPLLCRQHKLYPAFGASRKASARGPAFNYTSEGSSWNHHHASWQNLLTVAREAAKSIIPGGRKGPACLQEGIWKAVLETLPVPGKQIPSCSK